MKMGEGWDGGLLAGIAPIPTFRRRRGKELRSSKFTRALDKLHHA